MLSIMPRNSGTKSVSSSGAWSKRAISSLIARTTAAVSDSSAPRSRSARAIRSTASSAVSSTSDSLVGK